MTPSSTPQTPAPTGASVARHRDPRRRFFSEADCRDLASRLVHYAVGGGKSIIVIASAWRGGTRWARNRISVGSDVRTNHLSLGRDIHGAQSGFVNFNDTSDVGLVAALRRAERLLALQPERRTPPAIEYEFQEPSETPTMFSEATYQLDATQRGAVVAGATRAAVAAGMLSAGYLEVTAHSLACLTSFGVERYCQFTSVQYSVTVRDPKGVGSGWAGVDHWDWKAIDPAALSAIALKKCLASRNPVAVEPGRYTTILEPQAVAALVQPLISGQILTRTFEEDERGAPLNDHIPEGVLRGDDGWYTQTSHRGVSKLGERVIDKRITISADLMDPELSFPPFGLNMGLLGTPFDMVQPPVYHAATWFKDGVLTQLAYDLTFGVQVLGKRQGLPCTGSFRMSGGATSVEEMIRTTKRGLLVTRFDNVQLLSLGSVLCQGYTRDGLWLIENGKISKAVKNMRFTETPLFALNNVEQLGVPQRVFHPSFEVSELDWWMSGNGAGVPIIAPPLKVKDFSFTALSDAI